PGLNGFVGEFPILVGAYAASPRAAVLGATGMILGAFYLLWMLRRVVFGPLQEPSAHDDHGEGSAASHEPAGAHDHGQVVCRPIGWHEIAGLAPLMFLIVAVGVYPRPIFKQIRPATRALVQNIEAQRERAREDAARFSQAGQPIRARRAGGGT